MEHLKTLRIFRVSVALLIPLGIASSVRGDENIPPQTQADSITSQVKFGEVWAQSLDRGTTAWFETRFSVPRALGWIRTGDEAARNFPLSLGFTASRIALSDDGIMALVVSTSATETLWEWVDLDSGKATARRVFEVGLLFNPVFAKDGRSVLALQRIPKPVPTPSPETSTAAGPTVTSTPGAIELGLADPSTSEEAVLKGNDYATKFILSQLDQRAFQVVEVPYGDGVVREIVPQMAGGLVTEMLRSPDGSSVVVMVGGLTGSTMSLVNVKTGANIPIELPAGFNIAQSTFLRDGRLLLKGAEGFTLVTADGAMQTQVPLPEMKGGGVPKQFQQLRPNYSRNPLAANRPIEIGGSVYFLNQSVIAKINLGADPPAAVILLEKSKTALTGLYSVGDRLVADQWDSAEGTTGLAEIGFDGSVKKLLAEKALIFAVGSTQDQILAVRQSGDAPMDLISVNAEEKANSVTNLNPALHGLAMGKLERIGGNVLLRPTTTPPSDEGYPVVVFSYPNAQPSETPLAFETEFGGLPRRLALQGIASLFAHVTAQPTDKPDSDLSKELTDGTLRAVDAALATGGLDGKRLGFVGWSYGGFMAYCLATGTDRFSALVSGAGFIDPILSYAGQGDQAMLLGDQTTQGGLGGPPWKHQERYLKTGPLWRIESITAPILIVVGSEDTRVPPSESEQAFRLLRRAGKPAVLSIFPGGDHSLKRWPESQQMALANQVESWFLKTLYR